MGEPFIVFLDAAHGGAETGTTLAPQLLEKDLVLTLSIRLRSALAARGFQVVTTREGDTDPAPDTRAAEANHARAAACLVLHATASGTGVHLYTSSLGQSASASAGALVPWATAGSQYATESLKLASEISNTLENAGIPFTLGRVRLAPMDSLRCPAVAVEIAPLHPVGPAGRGTTARVSDDGYDKRVVDALADTLVEWRSEHEQVSGHAPGQVPGGAGR